MGWHPVLMFRSHEITGSWPYRFHMLVYKCIFNHFRFFSWSHAVVAGSCSMRHNQVRVDMFKVLTSIEKGSSVYDQTLPLQTPPINCCKVWFSHPRVGSFLSPEPIRALHFSSLTRMKDRSAFLLIRSGPVMWLVACSNLRPVW